MSKQINDYKTFLENNEYEEDQILPNHIGQEVQKPAEEDYIVPAASAPAPGIDEPVVVDTDSTPVDGSEEECEEECDWMGDDIEAVCLHCMRMYVNTHMWHLQTDSYAEHEALGEFYETLFELTDSFVEAAIANHGRLNSEVQFNLEILPIAEMVDEIEAFKQLLVDTKTVCGEDGMHNLMDDMISACDSVLYKLKNLK